MRGQNTFGSTRILDLCQPRWDDGAAMSVSTLRDQWDYLKSQPGFQKSPIRVVVNLLRWRWRTWIGRPVQIRLPGQQLTLWLPPEWHGAAKLLYVFRDDYEPDLVVLRNFLNPGGVMVDVGANYGIFSLNAARLVGKTGRVLAFEPARGNFSTLEKNLALNEATQVRAFQMALSDKPGTLRLYHDPDPTRNSLAPGSNAQDFEEVEVKTLDVVLSANAVGKIDFIKIDVEGADELVCRGALETLRKHLPPVFFENNSASALRMGLKAGGTAAVLAQLGYTLYQCERERLIKVTTTTPPEGNILALHSSKAPKI
jgi:FkbM family methyltransferase